MNKKSLYLLFLSVLLLSFSLEAREVKRPSKLVKKYFENTQNELEVVRIFGKEDGKTIFLLGGIQGDEPGGYLSAECYTDMQLQKGNLIVISRANFHSIILNKRAINVDMNRCFESPKVKNTVEDTLVKIISSYMAEADLFLNLHDGSGFYDTSWKSKSRNPKKYGQSVIADIDEYIIGEDTLKLETMAKQVLAAANKHIKNPDYRLHFLNTKTFATNTKYPEMRYSGSYYALNRHHIPAFGIESSKYLPKLKDKIYYHNLIINEFFKLFDIIPEIPGYNYDKAVLNFIHLRINDEGAKIYHKGETIHLKRGDKIRVTHINSNYTRGLSCDILGLGRDQDFNKKYALRHSTKLIIKKDSAIIGEIILKIDDKIHTERIKYILSINGEKREFSHLDSIIVKRGDEIAILDVMSDEFLSSEILVNLKGFAPPVAYNEGEDRNYVINTNILRWKKYSLHKQGKIYPIVVSLNDNEISRTFLSIK